MPDIQDNAKLKDKSEARTCMRYQARKGISQALSAEFFRYHALKTVTIKSPSEL